MKQHKIRLLLCVLVIALLFSGMHITAAARGKADSGQTEPVATEPAETSGAKGREEGKTVESESDEEEDEEDTKILIWGVLGVAAVAVIAIVAIQKSKQKKTYNPPAPSFESPSSPVILNDDNNRETDLWVPTPESYAGAPISNQGAGTSLYLYMEEGALKGKRYRITDKMLTLGRDYTCDIHFPAETKGVSRRHCQLCLKNGSVVIVDLGSSSGTFVRGEGRLSPNIPRELREGDSIYLGSKQQILKIIRK